MRIAWCTPFATRSRIGEFSAAVVAELRTRKSIEVDIFYPAGAGGRTVPDAGIPLGDDAVELLSSYDTIFYNMGNHFGYHGDLVDLANRVPGIAILHDISFAHLMLPRLMQLGEAELTQELVRRYGAQAADVAEAIRSDVLAWAWSADNVENHPMLSFVVDSALGVVTHSRFAVERVKSEYAGDVWNLPLPALPVASQGPPLDLAGLDDRPVVLQAGGVNPTKCVPTVIDAFAMAEVADRAQLVICGFAEATLLSDLRRQVVSLGVEGSVHVMGGVSDGILDGLRRRATVATVLRCPVGEASSAVLLDSMAYGLGIIAVNFGHYAEMPDDTLLRIDYPPSSSQLSRMIRTALDEPEKMAEIGARAQDYVRSCHTVAHYADGVLGVIENAGSVARRKDLATELASTIERIGFDSDDPISDRAVASAVELFGNKPTMDFEIFGA